MTCLLWPEPSEGTGGVTQPWHSQIGQLCPYPGAEALRCVKLFPGRVMGCLLLVTDSLPVLWPVSN